MIQKSVCLHPEIEGKIKDWIEKILWSDDDKIGLKMINIGVQMMKLGIYAERGNPSE